MRLHELAKEIGVPSKELLKLAREIGLNIKTHSSNIAAGEESILRIAMKQELEERAAEEAAAKEAAARARAEEEAKAAAERGELQIEAVAETASAEEAADAVGEAEGEPFPATEGALEVAASAGEAGEGAAQEAEGKATAVEETGEEKKEEKGAESGRPEKEKKAPPKIKRLPPRRPGATILGRIKLEPPAKPPREQPARYGDRSLQPSAPRRDVEDTHPPLPSKRGGRSAADRMDGLDEKDEGLKIKRSIKPKQQPALFDLDEDPLLQGIRIRHWDKHMRARRPSWRPAPKAKKRLKKFDHVVNKKVAVTPPVSVKDLSQLLGIKAQDLLRALMKRGVMAHINAMLDEEAVLQIALDFDRDIDIRPEKDEEKDFLEALDQEVVEEEKEGAERTRPPIVAFLGHVDHGKTSLLDAIRKTSVAASEDGGITQHISAYKVKTRSGQSVVFLDTPGHRAFTEMRARGAHTTDIVVLVVAADDGVMPQTEEAIQHAQAAGVPIVVAINKVDKANANPMRVKQQLAGVGVMTEDWGGEVGCVEVSAVTGQGLDDLLERLVLEAEIQELKCHPDLRARGWVLEARKDDEVGNVVTLLVRDGTLNLRDVVLAGQSVCRARALIDDQGRSVEEAPPSTPVNVIGFDTLPEAGEKFVVVRDAAKARAVAELRRERLRASRMAPGPHEAITLENLFASIEAGKIKEILVVLKADVKGTLEVLKRSLEDLVHKEVKVKVLRDGLGNVTEDDVLLAAASNAVVVGFHVEVDDRARKVAEEHTVDIRLYRVIYQLLDDMRAAMEGVLEPIKKERVTAHIEIREVFRSSRVGNIAGCYVKDGTLHRNDRVRVIRDGEEVYDGELESLKRFKDDQREVKEGFECGVKIAGFDDVREGDILEAYEIVEEKRTLDMEV